MNVSSGLLAFLLMLAMAPPGNAAAPSPLDLSKSISSSILDESGTPLESSIEPPSRSRRVLPQTAETKKTSKPQISSDILSLSPTTRDFFNQQSAKRKQSDADSQSTAPQDRSLQSAPAGLVAQPEARELGGVTLEASFETQQIKDAVAFIEFKMNGINTLMQECINQKYDIIGLADIKEVKNECVGLSYQILFFNYKEGLHKVKQIFLELLKAKLATLNEDYEDETNYFLDLLEELIEKDYRIVRSIDICKKASKYYVSPRYFESLMSIAKPEIDAFMQIHDRLRGSRRIIQDALDKKQKESDKFMLTVEQAAEEIRNQHEEEASAALQTQGSVGDIAQVGNSQTVSTADDEGENDTSPGVAANVGALAGASNANLPDFEDEEVPNSAAQTQSSGPGAIAPEDEEDYDYVDGEKPSSTGRKLINGPQSFQSSGNNSLNPNIMDMPNSYLLNNQASAPRMAAASFNPNSAPTSLYNQNQSQMQMPAYNQNRMQMPAYNQNQMQMPAYNQNRMQMPAFNPGQIPMPMPSYASSYQSFQRPPQNFKFINILVYFSN